MSNFPLRGLLGSSASCSVLCYCTACAVVMVAGAVLLVPRGACSLWLTGIMCVFGCLCHVSFLSEACLAVVWPVMKLAWCYPRLHWSRILSLLYFRKNDVITSDCKCAWHHIFKIYLSFVEQFFTLSVPFEWMFAVEICIPVCMCTCKPLFTLPVVIMKDDLDHCQAVLYLSCSLSAHKDGSYIAAWFNLLKSSHSQ